MHIHRAKTLLPELLTSSELLLYNQQSRMLNLHTSAAAAAATIYYHPHHRENWRRPCTVRGNDALAERRLPARGARRARGEPAVDAAGVEAVVAARQHAHLLPARELGEADGALRLLGI